MVKDPSDQKRSDFQLRSEAEAKLNRTPLPDASSRSAEELLHELHVYQIELEMQNETLRQAKTALESYVDLYEFSPVGYLTLTSVGLISEINLTAAKLLGVEREKLPHKHFTYFVIREDQNRWIRNLLSTKKYGEQGDLELALHRGDGTILHAQLQCRLQKDGTGSSVIRMALSDITQRKEASRHMHWLISHFKQSKADLRSLNTRLDFLLSSSPATIYTCEAVPPYAATFISANLTEMLGYTVKEFLATPGFWADHIHPEDRDRVFAGLPHLFAHGSHLHEYRFQHRDGSWHWMRNVLRVVPNPDGKIRELIGHFIDITEQKAAEMEIRALNENLEHLVTERTSELRERLKEITCLYEIRRGMKPESPLEEVCRLVLEQLVAAMQFPDIAIAEIELDGKRYATENYGQDLTLGLQAQIMVNGKVRGELQVFYREDQLFLLPEEQDLIDAIASDLGRWLERKQAEQRIMEMATHDVLTGLPNRNLLLDRIAQALAHDRRSQEQAAVLFIDLDHFKVINDSLGHDVGDLLLQEVATRLITAARGEDTVARRGGDEFIVLLPNITGPQDAEAVAQKILNGLMQPYYIHGKELHIGSSIGISLFPDDGRDVEVLLKNSDIAMYHAKESGRNNYQFFSSEMNRRSVERHSLGVDLRHALERNELLLYFQPVVDMPSAKLIGMEVLLRWQHSKQGLIPPSGFIPLAEETGMIVPIGEWVLRQSCLQIKAWQSQGYDVPKLAVNLSAQQFRQKTLVADIARILAETGVEGRCLTLEITESMLVENIEKTILALQQLNALGLEISIDDFGTGYSSLSYLKRYPINTLKIDRSFVRDIATDPNDAAIIAAIIAMARSLKMKVIAEGVETEEQLAFLMQQECGCYQGYYFSKPLPAVEAESKLQIH